VANIVSERYALSLYEVAKDAKKDELFLSELTAVCEIFAQNPDFLKVLSTPSIALEEKQTVLKNVFAERMEPFLLNFLMLITEKNRIGLVSDMCEAYKEMYYLENGIAEVCAVTAQPMSEALTEKLRQKMCKVTGKKVVLKTAVDPTLLGGIVVKVDNKQFDTSLRTRLSEMAQQLSNTIA